ncbi:MAG: HYR domain-containing protein [Bacteroidales bacterium]|nr:HYR domain-containing protein [Bacteroidales bacterium]
MGQGPCNPDITPPTFDILPGPYYANLDGNGSVTVSPGAYVTGQSDNCTAPNDIEFRFVDGTGSEHADLSFSCNDIGPKTLSILAFDEAGNRSTPQNVIINIRDNAPPAFAILPGPHYADLDGSGSVTVSPGDYVTGQSDNCTAPNDIEFRFVDGTEHADLPFSCNDTGPKTLSILAFDKAGNRSTPQTVIINIRDNAPPAFAILPGPHYADLDGIGNVTVSPGDYVTGQSDNCTAANDIEFRFVDGSEHADLPFSCNDTGPKTLSILAFDEAGNRSATQNVTVIIRDNAPPAFAILPGPHYADLDGSGSVTVSPGDYVTGQSDNCTAPNDIVFRFVDGTEKESLTYGCADIGKKTLTIVAYDLAGNRSEEEVIVNIRDKVLPSVTCPTFTYPKGLSYFPTNSDTNCTYTGSFNAPTATDNCTDDADLVIAYEIVNGVNPPITGNGSIVNIPFPVGTNTVTYTVTDLNGNADTCKFTVKVKDGNAPVITCPTVNYPGGNTYFPTDPDLCTSQQSFPAPSARDNCTDDADLVITYEIVNGANPLLTGNDSIVNVLFPVGTNTVTYTVADTSGNVATCTFDVEVKDEQLPNITCPTVNYPGGNTYFTTDPDLCTSQQSFPAPVATDNCTDDADLVITYKIVNNATLLTGNDSIVNVPFPVGTNTVTYTVADTSGNVATCTFDVEVEDKQSPAIACPTFTYPAGLPHFPTNSDTECTYTGSFSAPTATDNCTDDADLVITYRVVNGATLRTGADSIVNVPFPVGTNTVTYTVTDLNGNADSCSFTVEVEDGNAPVITCPTVNYPGGNTYFPTDPDSCTSKQSFSAPTASDNCTPPDNLVKTYKITDADGTEIDTGMGDIADFAFPVGTNTVTYIVTDAVGNADTCTFDVEVRDKQSPAVTCPTVIYPSGLPHFPTNSDTDCTYTGSFSAPTATDNCTDAADLVITYKVVNNATLLTGNDSIVNVPFPVGTNTVTYIVKDAAGNADSCSFTVEVEDGNAPVITCPTVNYPGISTYFTTDPDKCFSKQSFPAPTADDNCTPSDQLVKTYEIATVDGVTPGTGDIVDFDFPVGTNTVTCIVTDAAGNADTCAFDVEVRDEQLPTPECKDITVTLDILSGEATITAADIDNGSRDNCLVASMTLSKEKFDCRDIGNIPVTLTVEDASGNRDSCTATVLVRYDGAPVPQVTFRKEEICSDTDAELDLTNPRFEPVTDWSWTASVPAGIIPATGLDGTASGDTTIIRQFENTADAAENVTYTVTPTLYGQCTLSSVSREVSVNPRPKLLAMPDTSICNNTGTEKIVGTVSQVSAGADVYYSWTVVDNPDVDGEADSPSEQIIGTAINQNLNNRTFASRKVTYILSPSLHLSGDVCSYAGYDEPVEITVEPAPVIKVSVDQDTVCNNTTVIFTVDSLNSPAGQWQYILKTAIPDNDLATPDVSGRKGRQNESFSQTLYNDATGWHRMRYDFSPQIITRQGYTCQAPAQNDTLVAVRVNPTPFMSVVNFQDSICFKDDGPEIRITSNNGEVLGDLKYNLWKVDYAGSTVVENVVAPGVANFTGRAASIDQTALWNRSNTEQTVAYYIYPFIEYRNSLYCSGDSVEQKIYLASELLFDLVDSTYYGGRNVTCYGASDGIMNVLNQTGGWSANGYDYQWSGFVNSINAPRVANRSASTYGVTVIDKLIGCQAHKDVTLTQPEKLIILDPLFADIKHPDCNGPTGYINVHVTGGTRTDQAPYKFEARLRDDDAVFYYSGEDSVYTNLQSGFYIVNVVDTHQCAATREYELQYFNGITTMNPNWQHSQYGPDAGGRSYDISCHGAGNGSMNPNPDPNITLFSKYTWKYNGVVFKEDTIGAGDPYFTYAPASQGGGDFQLTGLEPGYYDLILVDNRGCTFTTDRQTLTEPAEITFNASVSKYANNYEVKCDGAKDGQITISDIAGSYGTYKYEWDTPDGDPTDIVAGASEQTALGAGTYSLKILSGLVQCDTVVSFTLHEPPALVIAETISDYNSYEVKCYGDHSGIIRLNVSGGGNGSYSYQWTTADGSGLAPQAKDQEALSAGIYTVSVGYSSGLCARTEQYTLHAPLRLQNDSVVSGIKCYGDTNASIQISISGGVPSYTYQWSSPDGAIPYPNVEDQSGLAPGTYRLAVIDGNGCIKTEVYSLPEPAPVSPNLAAEDMSCDPGNDGYITANPSGGTGNSYSYVWCNGETTPAITGLTADNYSVTVTDMNGCTGTDSAFINIPSALTVTATALSGFNGYHIDCYGNSTGKIALDILNGRGEYQYLWQSGDVSGGLEHLAAGFYSVEVADKFNCKGDASITLTQPDRLWGQSVTTDITCPGGNDGSIQVQAGGGVTSLPYGYQWSNGAADSPMADNLTAGAYTIRVTDKNNCTLDLQVTLTQPPAFAIDFISTAAFCPETRDGDIRAAVSGGTPPYAYLWPGVSGAVASGITDVRAGAYTLELTDAMNCTYSQTVELGYTSNECLRIPNAFSPNSDGANDRWEITVGDAHASVRYPLGDLYPDAIIEVYSGNWGLLLYRSQKGYPEPWDGKYHGKYLPVNSYVYIIKLNHNSRPITGNVTIIK